MLFRVILITCAIIQGAFTWGDDVKTITIPVGAYEFPPFFEIQNGERTGITPLLVKAFNQAQQQYDFELVITSPKRRYIDFQRGRIKMLFFEDPKWGWKGYPVVTSDTFLKGGEVFIAKKNRSKNQSAFKNISDRKIAAMLGYHYQFADWKSDTDTLHNRFNITLLSHTNAIIKQVISGKADIGIISRAFLDREIYRNPTLAKSLLISDFYDQTYSHRIMLAQDANIDIKRVNRILKKLYDSGKLTTILSRFGLTPSAL